MGILQRLMGRKPNHEEWLATHPGKESTKAPPPSIDVNEQDRMRTQMEGEMNEQRSRREQP